MTKKEVEALVPKVKERMIEKLIDHAAEVAIKKGSLQAGTDRFRMDLNKFLG